MAINLKHHLEPHNFMSNDLDSIVCEHRDVRSYTDLIWEEKGVPLATTSERKKTISYRPSKVDSLLPAHQQFFTTIFHNSVSFCMQPFETPGSTGIVQNNPLVILACTKFWFISGDNGWESCPKFPLREAILTIFHEKSPTANVSSADFLLCQPLSAGTHIACYWFVNKASSSWFFDIQRHATKMIWSLAMISILKESTAVLLRS